MKRGFQPLEVERILLASVAGNSLVCILKIVGGLLSGSMALLADGSDSLLNVASGLIAFKFYRESRKPPDKEHRYGHTMLEVYGSLLILLLMVATFSFVGYAAVDRFLHRVEGKVSSIGITFAVVSLAINLCVSTFLKLTGGGSAIALTEARHASLDVLEGIVTLVGVSLGATLSILYDTAATFVILGMVAYFVSKTLMELEKEITAASPPEEAVRRLEEVFQQLEGVVSHHDLRVRRAAGRVFADVHLVVKKGLSIEDVHRVCDEAERRAKRAVGDALDIVIHAEPEGEG